MEGSWWGRRWLSRIACFLREYRVDIELLDKKLEVPWEFCDFPEIGQLAAERDVGRSTVTPFFAAHPKKRRAAATGHQTECCTL